MLRDNIIKAKLNFKCNLARYLASLLLLTASCSTIGGSAHKKTANRDVSSEVLDGFDAKRLGSIFLLPVLVEDIGAQSFGVPSVQATDSLTTALEVYTQIEILGGVGSKDKINGFSAGDKNESSYELSQLGTSTERLFKIAQEVSKEQGNIPVLFCLLQKSKERTGSGLGAEVPAQAKYRMWLYDGKAEKIVWTSAYRTKEQAVTENLFSLGSSQGVSFSPLNDLITSGFRGSAKSLDKILRIKRTR